MAAAFIGGPMFLIGTILHPARDGHGIAAVGELYGITHSVQAIGLLLLVVALAGMLTTVRHESSWSLVGWYSALVGTLSWFGLIVYDGSHNPVMARFAPDLVHNAADLEAGGAIIVLPALLLFPLGYALLGVALYRSDLRWAGLLAGGGALVYTIGGLLIFELGPSSPLVQTLEVAGFIPFAIGFVLLAVGIRTDQSVKQPVPAGV
jgi:hypothetical protein